MTRCAYIAHNEFVIRGWVTAEASGMRHIGVYRIAILMAFISLLAHRADAGLMLELTTDGATPGNGKLLTLTNADIGTPITLDIWAAVTGADASVSNDGLQSVNLNFASIGPTLGNLANLTMSSFFHANFAQGGAQHGAAGDLDLGGTDPGSATNWWIARSSTVQAQDGPASDGLGSFLLGTISFTPTAVDSGPSMLQVNVRNALPGALWFEDSTKIDPGGGAPLVWTNDKSPTINSVTIGTPIIIVPEPATVALSLVMIPLMRRRRR